MRPVTSNPLPDDPRLGDAVRQQDLFSDLHDKPDRLRQIPWERTGQRRGFIETQEMERQALVNDFMFHGLPLYVRLCDLDALRALWGDPAKAELVVMGPGRQAATYPHLPIPDEPYTITPEWREYNAFFANWLNHRAAEDPQLGAPYTRMRKVRKADENGEVTIEYRPEPNPGTRLFAWRTPADMADGTRPSGLIVPGTLNVFAAGDGDADEESGAAPAPPAAAPQPKGRR